MYMQQIQKMNNENEQLRNKCVMFDQLQVKVTQYE